MTFAVKALPGAGHPNHSVPRDGLGRPMIVPKGGGRPVPHTRVTTYIDCIEDKSNLTSWKLRTALVGLADKPSLLDAVRGLDPDDPKDKRKLDGLVERALELGGANRASKKGTSIHELTELVDQRKDLPENISEADLGDIVAYMVETSCLTMTAIEQFVVVSELAVAGTFDRTALDNEKQCEAEGCPGLHIVDLKTGTMDYGKIKMPSQLATYSRGQRYDFTLFPAPDRLGDPKGWEKWKKTEFSAEEAAAAYSPLPAVCQDWGIIIHLPQGKAECTLYWADLKQGWGLAEFAGEVRSRRSVKGTLKKFSPRLHTPPEV